MAWIEHSSFHDVDEFLQCLGKLNKLQKLTWRGQARDFGNGAVHSSFDRVGLKIDTPAKYKVEQRLALRFRDLAEPIMLDNEKAFLNDGPTLLMLMQHYGAPTRLVDWTLSPYTAAYFVVNRHDDSDGIMWGFDGTVLDNNADKLHHAETANIPKTHPKDNLPLMMFNEYGPWVRRLMDFKMPLLKRMSNQEGVFTVGGRHDIDHITAIDELVGDNEGGGKHIIRIDESMKVDLLRKLNVMNKNGLMFFCDLEGVGKSTAEYARYMVDMGA